MRKSLFLALPFLLAACADNTVAPGSVTPAIDGIDCTQSFIDTWPEPYELRLHAQLPDPAEQEYSASVLVTHVDVGDTLEWTLLDDGDLLSLGEGVDGQLSHSGDNIPGDGIFTALIDPAFSELYGEFTLLFRLSGDDVLLASQTLAVSRNSNTPPSIDEVLVDSALASGDTLEVSATISDEDGQDDIVAVSLLNMQTSVSWELLADDSQFVGYVGPEIAAGCQGVTQFRLEALDHSQGSAVWDLNIELENTPPSLSEADLELYVWGGNSSWELFADSSVDTMRIEIPSAGDIFVFQFRMPVADAQTLLDIELAQVLFRGLGNGTATPIPGSYEGDTYASEGVYELGFSIEGRDPGNPFNNMSYELTFSATDRVGGEAQSFTRIIQLYFPE